MHIDLQSEFIDIYKKLELTDCNNQFILDGIIDPELYNDKAIKILFIAKEHNKLEDQYKGEPSYSTWWKGHVLYTFSHRISEWAYGIFNNFPDYSEIQDYNRKHEALRSIAFINVKKVCGGASSNHKVMYEYIHNSKQLLQRQILEIAPTHIICCFRYNWYLEELFDMKDIPSGPNSLGYILWNNIPVINYFHPSCRKNKDDLYNGLKSIFHHVTHSLK